MTQPLLLPHEQNYFAAEYDGALIERTVLPNGVRVLTERVPSVRSTAIGFWVGVGSRDEQATNPEAVASLGSTHFLEHLLFKGTKTRSAYQLAAEFDMVGALHNAMTAKEYTAYHAKVRDFDVPVATSLLVDMVCNSVLSQDEFVTEKQVILEELAMDADDYEDVAYEQLFSALLPEHPLGRPIGGTVAEITACKRDSVWQHYQQHYVPAGLIVTAAGAIEHQEFVALLQREFNRAGGNYATGKNTPLSRRKIGYEQLQPAKNEVFIDKDSAQTHVLLGARSIHYADQQRFAARFVDAVLGGGMSSRLFQEIREKRGLAYSTYATSASYSSAGIFAMYAGCAPEKTGEVLQIARQELEKMATCPISDEEYQRAFAQLATGSVFALEQPKTRMHRLALAELSTGEIWGLDAVSKRLLQVQKSDISNFAQTLLENLTTTVIVGDKQRVQL